MSELKPCEAIEILENGDWWCWLSSELDSESEPSTDLHNAIDTAISALRRAQPDNEPMTLEELQKGDVVWIKDLAIVEIECLRFDRIEPATYHTGDDYRFDQFGTNVGIIRWACKYGINWLAYRRSPERGEG